MNTPLNTPSSSCPRIQETPPVESSKTNKFLNNVKSELQVKKIQKRTERELHQKRVQSLRKELEYLKATEWKYQPVDKYINQKPYGY